MKFGDADPGNVPVMRIRPLTYAQFTKQDLGNHGVQSEAGLISEGLDFPQTNEVQTFLGLEFLIV